MTNTAYRILWPIDPTVLVRVVFLHVGQGASALVLAAGEGTYRTLLIDINLDSKRGGIDVPRLIADMVGARGLDVFVNTHPHNDHLCGLEELAARIAIRHVWHSGHVPAGDHCDAYNGLRKVMSKVRHMGGSVGELRGSRSSLRLGDVPYYVLAPAEYVTDDIADETPEGRNARIHEHCAVLKFGIGSSWIMVTGDADRDAWEQHITAYHKDRLGASVLAAPHHGSRTFFQYEEEDQPYLDAFRAIDPDYVIISAPRPDESQFGHPHEEAVKLYSAHVGKNNVLHTGENRQSFICDVYRDGRYRIVSDNGVLAQAYAYKGDGSSKHAPEQSYPLSRIMHLERLPWSERRTHNVKLNAYTYAKSGKRLGGIKSDGRILSAGLDLKFVAQTNAPNDAEVYWQVVNTGKHAESVKGSRGEIFRGKLMHKESRVIASN